QGRGGARGIARRSLRSAAHAHRSARAMNAPLAKPLVFHAPGEAGELARRLKRSVKGAVMVDRAARGRYATDASIYQVDPVGVLVPTSHEDVRAAFDVCRELQVPV